MKTSEVRGKLGRVVSEPVNIMGKAVLLVVGLLVTRCVDGAWQQLPARIRFLGA